MTPPNITPPPYTVQFSDHHADDSKIIADGEVIAIMCSRGHLPEQHATTKAFAAVPDLLTALAAIRDASDDFRLTPFELRTAAGHLASHALLKAGYTS
jgi:hypothetical protein